MESILDELSLVPCASSSPGARIVELAKLLQAFDKLGAPKVLRSMRDAADRDLQDGGGFRRWCFDRATDKDAGRFVAARLNRAPYIDGPDGLFDSAQGKAAVDAIVSGTSTLGAGLAALTDGVLLRLSSMAKPIGGDIDVELHYLDDVGESTRHVHVPTFVAAREVDQRQPMLTERLERALKDGGTLITRAPDLFPRLRFGATALEQIGALPGADLFRLLVRNLRILDKTAVAWTAGTPFEPEGIRFSTESASTLSHSVYGPKRDFPMPSGFAAQRWSLHAKLTGAGAPRLYYRPEQTSTGGVVLIGYFGHHLPTVEYPT